MSGRQQPKTRGVQRIIGRACMHEEVMKNLQEIAENEDKSFSWVVADIVYAFFGLKVDEHTVKVLRRLKRFKRFTRQQKNILKFRKAS
jgi:hypothetical protein